MRHNTIVKATALAALGLGLAHGVAAASDLVYTPINPVFGGNPFNGAFLLSLAIEQRPEEDSGDDGGGGGGSNPANSLLSDLLNSESSGSSGGSEGGGGFGVITQGTLLTLQRLGEGLVIDITDLTGALGQ